MDLLHVLDPQDVYTHVQKQTIEFTPINNRTYEPTTFAKDERN